MKKYDLSEFEKIFDVINKIKDTDKNVSKELELDLSWNFFSQSKGEITNEYNLLHDKDIL